ncbi:MAG: DUF4275 family protein [Candidatus Diapherotrites archaeon]|nr:DUF4275 family protein [Candidatus Diapherotrites archaeon]
MSSNSFLDFLKDKSKYAQTVSASFLKSFRNQWRSKFAFNYFGITMHAGPCCMYSRSYDWHYFSYRDFQPTYAYFDSIASRTSAREWVIVFLEECNLPGLRIQFSELKNFLKNNPELNESIYFTPESFAWTLVFTHEYAFGPYLYLADNWRHKIIHDYNPK